MTSFPCPPPLTEDLLKQYNFFQLYVLDGGGNFIMKELFGNLDDSLITEKLLHTDMMDEFGGMESLDFHKFEKWRSIEKSCWINRFYFLVPIARIAWLHGNKKLARIVGNVILYFFRKEIPPAGKNALKEHWERVTLRMKEDYNSRSYDEIIKDETDVEYIWYDMQVGQRLICFMYASFFIWELSDDETKDELASCLKLHARVIADQESFQTPYQDNHQSVRATALWWALPLLKNEPDYEQIYRATKKLCEWHIMNEFLPSGMLFENSPSYHAFVVWHSRDFLNIARMRGEDIAPEISMRFAKAGEVLACCGRSDGKSLTINDSYQYDAFPLIASLGSTVKAPDFAVIKPGGLAVASSGNIYVAVDVSSFTGEFSHYHGGKNSLVLLWNGIPFLEETGCPSYDRPEFPLCKRSDHHSTLLIDNTGDSHQFGLYGFDNWAETEYDDHWTESAGRRYFSSVLTSNLPEWNGVSWKRTVGVHEKGIQITDQVRCDSKSHHFRLLFCLAPDVTVIQNGQYFQLSCRGENCIFSIKNPDATLSLRKIVNCQQPQPRNTLQIQADFGSGKTLECISEFSFESNINIIQ